MPYNKSELKNDLKTRIKDQLQEKAKVVDLEVMEDLLEFQDVDYWLLASSR